MPSDFSALELRLSELESLERSPVKPTKKRAAKKTDGKPRDELGRYTRLKKKE
jgi:hypothetical protein